LRGFVSDPLEVFIESCLQQHVVSLKNVHLDPQILRRLRLDEHFNVDWDFLN
jgi:hypothetical protein